jgi:pyruvate-formate lyase-activating enzyme
MRKLTLAETEELRRAPGATVALFLTDRCPVGCGHCSVGSRVDSATISDWVLFTEVVAGICTLPDLQAVAITGGEPFSERRGLIHAVRELHGAGKAVILFTSGYWAGEQPLPWIFELLRKVSTVYLSTDSFHLSGSGRAVGQETLERAVRVIEDAGCQLVLQVLDEPGAAEEARRLSMTADLSVIPALPTGRGKGLFIQPAARPAESFGRCHLVNSPTVRYDGTVTACCNESVITGSGPDELRRQVSNRDQVAAALTALRRDPVLKLIGAYGPRALEVAVSGPFRTVCHACWSAHETAGVDPKARTLLTLLAGAR